MCEAPAEPRASALAQAAQKTMRSVSQLSLRPCRRPKKAESEGPCALNQGILTSVMLAGIVCSGFGLANILLDGRREEYVEAELDNGDSPWKSSRSSPKR